MKTLTAAAIATGLLMSNQVYAADLAAKTYYKAPPPIAYLPWSKCYAGVTLGYTRAETSPTLRTVDPNLQASIDLGNVATRPGNDPDGVIGGGTLGCNRQYDRIVVSIETDIPEPVRAAGSIQFKVPTRLRTPAVRRRIRSAPCAAVSATRSTRRCSTEPAVWLTGTSKATSRSCPRSPVRPSLRRPRTAGKPAGPRAGGIEHLFAPNWSLKAEYLYYDLGTSNLAYVTVAGAPNETGILSYRNTGQIISRRLIIISTKAL